MAIFQDTTADEAKTIIARYPVGRERSAIMPLLYLAQSVEGYISVDAMREIGELVGVTTAEVEAVASFYTMYQLHPCGTHAINVCTNLACLLRGAKDVLAAATDAAGVPPMEHNSPDGVFSVHEEECLGVCDFAPAVQVNFMNHDNVTPERMREIVAALKAGDVPTPSRGPVFGSLKEASRALAGLEPVAQSPVTSEEVAG